MLYLFKFSLEQKSPIELIYMKEDGEVSHRTVIVRKIYGDRIATFCMKKQTPRTFKLDNILSAAKPTIKKKYMYA